MSSEHPSSSLDAAAVERALLGDGEPTDWDARHAALQAHGGARSFVGDLQTALKSSGEMHDPDASYAALQARIDRDERQRVIRGRMHTERRSATLAGGILLGAAIVAAFVWTSPFRHSPVDVRMYTTNIGQQITVPLTDGSRMILAPASRAVVEIGIAERRVVLTGEAQFQVKGAAQIPFVVRTGKVTTRVLGTTFGVRHYATDRVVRVVVHDGKVVSQNPRTAATLSEGMVGTLTDSSAVTSRTDAATYVNWNDGRLIFHETPVPELLATLSRWYGYEFRTTDSVLTHGQVTATFMTNAPDETMALLKDVLNVTMTFHGRVVTLQREHSHGTTERRMIGESYTPSMGKGK